MSFRAALAGRPDPGTTERGWISILESWRKNPAVFWIFALPGTFWMVAFFLMPLGLVWAMSFAEKTSIIDYDVTGTLSNYVRSFNPVYLQILWKSVWISVLATVACLLLAYPIAFGIVFAPARWKPLLLLLMILPFWINLLIRTYALIAVLRTRGYLNFTLEWLWLKSKGLLGLIGLGH